MNDLPCIICENGDLNSGILCVNCHDILEEREDTYKSIMSMIMEKNNVLRISDDLLVKEIEDKVKPLFKQLCEIKVDRNNSYE